MPCHLCEVRSEDYPKPAMFKTAFMVTAFPGFKLESDFLCPKCYAIYFRIIESKYGPQARKTTNARRAEALAIAVQADEELNSLKRKWKEIEKK